MPAPKPKAQPQAETTVESKVDLAVKAYVVGETETNFKMSTLSWGIVQALRAGVKEERSDNDLRKTLIDRFKAAGLGETALKSKGPFISHALKIARADDEKFDKWKKEGTAFINAYEEVTTPHNKSVDENKQWTKPGLGSEDDIKNREAQPSSNAGGQHEKTAEQKKEEKKYPEDKDPTAGWATIIDRRPDLWGKLLDNLTDKNAHMLNAQMAADVTIRLFATSKLKAKDMVGIIIQKNEPFVREFLSFLEANPQFDPTIQPEPPFSEAEGEGVPEEETAETTT